MKGKDEYELLLVLSTKGEKCMDTYTEKELQEMDAETRAEEREAHRRVLNCIADAERILASDDASAKLKDLASKFLVQARQVAEIQQASMGGGNLDKYRYVLVPSCQAMVRLLDELNEELENMATRGTEFLI